MGSRINIPKGERFERLTLIKEVEAKKYPSGRKLRCFVFFCDCGNETIQILNRVRLGDVKSCGCYRLEKFIERSITHGKRKCPEYNAWASMKSRCYNPRVRNYSSYGGRGIKVCERWLHSFENFFEDMGRRPSEEHSIERVDNNGDYCPQNCKWATIDEQANNTRTNVLIEFRGKVRSLKEWSEIFGISRSILYKRLHRGWELEKAFTQRPRVRY